MSRPSVSRCQWGKVGLFEGDPAVQARIFLSLENGMLAIFKWADYFHLVVQQQDSNFGDNVEQDLTLVLIRHDSSFEAIIAGRYFCKNALPEEQRVLHTFRAKEGCHQKVKF